MANLCTHRPHFDSHCGTPPRRTVTPINRVRFSRWLTLLLLKTGIVPVLAVPPPNDPFSSPTPLAGTDITVTGTNVDASKEPGEPDHGANSGGSSVWWS